MSASDPRPIGVFDSGLGGLTVLRSLIDLLPGESMIYFGDTGRFPYGPKPHDEVHKYALEIADLLVARDAKLLVVACNSATSVALESLRERFDIPWSKADQAQLEVLELAVRKGWRFLPASQRWQPRAQEAWRRVRAERGSGWRKAG